ncbi:sodium:calcium antiporter (plasmid) [Halostagnicola larsenii XH-48]|uniref:Sodium:calcium antiporter n=1 Tax=Halostagnicola larsenii XH-48 TaxID=797299 RepID=W0JWB7_9EURY|nr:sodium:calcium antiporter [Halostagnicola larsenii]AHG01348.1 sodium:calcium antiporter [Halostagnicola larsenii XH-48]
MVLGGLLQTSTLGNILIIVVATGLVWIGSNWLEASAEQLSGYYGLPAVVQGSIVVAIGSSFPELASVVVTALSGTFNMGVGAIVGSAIFNILVIPAISGIAADGDLETNRAIVYKEAQFYMLAVSTVIITFALAVIYVPASDGPELTGHITRPLALIPLLLYGLYIFIQWQDVSDHEAGAVTEGIAVWREWGKLAAGLAVILLAVELLVGSVESLSTTFGIPEFIAGVTIIAAATSLPDTFVSVRLARDGKGITSLGNVLGSNTFDLLVAIPIGVLIVGQAPVDFAVGVPMLGVLTFATVLLFSFLRTDLLLSKLESTVLLLAYAFFVVWILAETVGVTQLIKTA